MGNYNCAVTFLVGTGLVFIVLGSGIRLGYWRRWYLGPDDPIFYPKLGVYGLIPLGLACMILAFGLVFPGLENWFVLDVPVGLAFLAILLVGLQPWWIKPAWVRWLEEENADIFGRLIEEARWTKEWDKRIATQEGLEALVAEVRKKWVSLGSSCCPGQDAPTFQKKHGAGGSLP